MKKAIELICLSLAVIMLLPIGLIGCSTEKNTEFTLPNRTMSSEIVKFFGSYEYRVYDDNTAIIVAYTGKEGNVVIPEALDGSRVVAIDTAAFANNTSMTSVVLNESLESIAAFAFADCSSLSAVEFNKKLWSVGRMAFANTPWLASRTEEFVVIGDGVLLQYQGKATDVKLPENIRHLSAAFMSNETIVNIDMGDNVQTIGEGVFAGCTSLCRVGFGPNIKMIGERAFEGCISLTAAYLPEKLEVIGSSSFIDCSKLKIVKSGPSLRTIGPSAFENCLQLRTAYLPASIENIGNRAFYYCLSFSMLNYDGSIEQFKSVTIGDENYMMLDAERIYKEEAEK